MIQAMYQRNDVPGECLVRPLKIWHELLVSRIEVSSRLGSLAWKVGYLLDILLGPLAGIGMLIKWPYYAIKLHNDAKLPYLKEIRKGILENIPFSPSNAQQLGGASSQTSLHVFPISHDRWSEDMDRVEKAIETSRVKVDIRTSGIIDFSSRLKPQSSLQIHLMRA